MLKKMLSMSTQFEREERLQMKKITKKNKKQCQFMHTHQKKNIKRTSNENKKKPTQYSFKNKKNNLIKKQIKEIS